MAQIGFDSIARQIREGKSVLTMQSQNSSIVEARVRQWKQQHETVCDYVHHLNRSFGGFLLFEVGCNFAGLITHCFYLVLALQDNWPTNIYALSIIAFFRYSIPLFVICIVCDNIRSQVTYKAGCNLL